MPPAFASASASGRDLDALLEEVAARALADLGPGDPPDLAVLFVTPDFGPAHATAGPAIRERTGALHLLGCSGGGVIGSESEREGGRSAALFLARMPGMTLDPRRFAQEDLADLAGIGSQPVRPAKVPGAFLLLADPYSIDAEALLEGVQVSWSGWPVIGGLASGGHRPGVHALWLDGETLLEGAVGLALTGDAVSVRPLVSQGCRPIGKRFVVTKVDGPRIRTLAGKPAAAALRETLEGLPDEDRELARTGLHLGIVANESRPDFHRGDFLIRNLMAIVPEDGSLVVGDQPDVGQTIQFQLRDAATATEDLGELLDREAAAGRPAGGLLFSCGGRGSHLFGEPDHDLHLLQEKLGAFPLAGFFCNGEIGPVGARSFLHGFTSSLALFSGK